MSKRISVDCVSSSIARLSYGRNMNIMEEVISLLCYVKMKLDVSDKRGKKINICELKHEY